MGINTPWGVSDGSERQAPGMTWYTTPSHGALKLAPELVAKIPSSLMPPKDGPWYQQLCWNGWFEEDCEWARVALAFPRAFTEKQVTDAADTVKFFWPDVWRAYELAGRPTA